MNIISSVWQYKCPRCRQGEVYKKPLNFKKPLDMHDRCDVCDLDLHPEPGYYFGAMFISYIWTGFFCLTVMAFFMLVMDWGVNASMLMLILVMVTMYIFVLRVSRVMYLHMDVKYDKNVAKPK